MWKQQLTMGKSVIILISYYVALHQLMEFNFFFFLQKDKQVLTLEYFHCYGFLILEKWFTTLEAHWNHLRALRNSHA